MKKSVSLAAALVALVLVSGCQSADRDTPDAAATASASASVDPARPAPGDSVDPAAFMEGIFTATQEAGSARFTLTSGGGPDRGGMSIIGSQDINAGTADFNTTIPTTPGRKMAVTMRVVDGVVYANVPGYGGGWISIGPEDVDTPFGAQFMSLVASTPLQQFEDVRDAVTAVEVVGAEELAGERTTRYEVTVDPQKVAGPTAEDVATFQDVGALTFDYWLDAQGRMRRVENDTLGVKTVMDMSSWGEPVNVEAPEPSTVTPARDIDLGVPTVQQS